MGYTKRCFSNVAALQRLTPQVLRDLLALFPEYVAERGLTLPEVATADNLEYLNIRDALMADGVPADLDDILFLASRLGNSSGWDVIQRQADEDRRTVLVDDARFGYPDLAIMAAIEDWPKHKLFLEKASARARVHSRSAYVYYAPTKDPRGLYCGPSEDGLAEAREALANHFIQQGLVEDLRHGRATQIVPYDFDKEIWFLIRYPGKQSRHGGCDRSGEWSSFVFNPEEYDAVAYNKVYADLRMNTERKRDHVKYRVVFGNLLFGDESNVFRPDAGVVNLAPFLKDNARELFGCRDIPGLACIEPVELKYDIFSFPVVHMTEKADDGESLLLDKRHGPRLVPRETVCVTEAVLRYRLRDTQRFGRLTLRTGNRVNYERDGDSLVVEQWLRRRGFVRSFVEVNDDVVDTVEQIGAVAVG